MIKLLIVDDEPLVQAGIKSMINWEDLNISIVGIASNGVAAYEMIKKYDVEIVITDIKMPVMSGLELARKCVESGMDVPVFIILTGYEDFHYAKEALTIQAIDYLIKLELTPETLIQSLNRAIARLSELRYSSRTPDIAINTIFKEQFFTRLIFNLFEDEHQFLSQSRNLKIDFNYELYVTGYIEINSVRLGDMAIEKQISLYSSSLQLVSELMSKYIPCHVVSLDTRHFCIIFFLKENDGNYKETIQKALAQIFAMIFNYYSVTIRSSIGSAVNNPMQIPASYQMPSRFFRRSPKSARFLLRGRDQQLPA